MKKLTSIALAIMIGCSLVACDNEKTTGTATENIQYTADVQFKKDYEALEKWDKASKVKIEKHFDVITQEYFKHKPSGTRTTEEEAIEFTNKMKKTVEEIFDELEELNIKSPELEDFIEHQKDFYRLAEKTLELTYILLTKSPEEKLEYQSEADEITKESQKFEDEESKLRKKIEEKYKSLMQKEKSN